MNVFAVIIWCTLALVCFGGRTYAQGTSDVTNAALYLNINGGGSVTPLQDGQSLVVGQTYQMQAIADLGFTFSSWQEMNVFVEISVFTNFVGVAVTNPPSVIYNLVPSYTTTPTLTFTMQPAQVLVDTNGTTVTESQGWQANFEAIPEPPTVVLLISGFTLVTQIRFRQFWRGRFKLPNTALEPTAGTAWAETSSQSGACDSLGRGSALGRWRGSKESFT